MRKTGSWLLAAIVTLTAGSGCCRLCHRWCNPPPYGGGYPQQQPVCVPVPACPPGTTPAFSAPLSQSGWQRGPSAQPLNACCYP